MATPVADPANPVGGTDAADATQPPAAGIAPPANTLTPPTDSSAITDPSFTATDPSAVAGTSTTAAPPPSYSVTTSTAPQATKTSPVSDAKKTIEDDFSKAIAKIISKFGKSEDINYLTDLLDRVQSLITDLEEPEFEEGQVR